MANFKTHVTVGVLTSVIGSVACFWNGLFVSVVDAIFSIVLGTIGSILPDIDAEQSIPTRITFSILGFVAVGVFLAYCSGKTHIGILIVGCVLAYMATKFLLPKILSKFMRHRGVFHSVPMAILLALVLMVALIDAGYKIESSIMFGCFLAGGFLVHLTLDEIYSVDIAGARLKLSFGTALQIFSFSQPIPYLLLYGLIVYISLTLGIFPCIISEEYTFFSEMRADILDVFDVATNFFVLSDY